MHSKMGTRLRNAYCKGFGAASRLEYSFPLLIVSILAFRSWNFFWAKEGAAHELVLTTNRPAVPAVQQQQHLSLEAPPGRVTAGARTLNFHHDPDSGSIAGSKRTFTGMLAPDGSVSSVNLMMESDQFAEYPMRPANLSTTNSGDNGAAADPSSPLSQGQRNATQQSLLDREYPPCPDTMRDLIPCSSAAGHLYGRCPNVNRGSGRCAIAAPRFYARQFKWPASKNQVRGPNVPNVPILHQSWIGSQLRESNIIHFGDEDPRFPNGTDSYVGDLVQMIPGLNFETKTRVALDIGCGTGNVAAALETRGVLTLSINGESAADNGVQLVVERGYPAMVQSIDNLRLPYPSQAFDLIHCAACDVDWANQDGLRSLEADRILRAGGLFVRMQLSDTVADQKGMEDLTKSICWRKLAEWRNISVWQKPAGPFCNSTSAPPPCNASSFGHPSWNVPLDVCRDVDSRSGDSITYTWPLRLETPPRRLKQVPAAGLEDAKDEAFKADMTYWMYTVAFYMENYGPTRISEIRNVLDMNAGYGGFAAAVATSPLQWWVLNVVPIDQADRLAVVFDRGLVGVYHDWCESLDVYPRTFDMVHSSGLFSQTVKQTYSRCDMGDIVQEMDRVLRPGGFAIIRDQEDVLLQVQILARALHWKAVVEDTDSGPVGKDKILSCQKRFWRPTTDNRSNP